MKMWNCFEIWQASLQDVAETYRILIWAPGRDDMLTGLWVNIGLSKSAANAANKRPVSQQSNNFKPMIRGF